MKAILVKANNDVVIGNFTFEQMQKQFKSGFAEIVRPMGLDLRYIMVVDEEGLLNGSPLNKVGCRLYRRPIVGDFFICADKGTDFGSLSDKDAQELKVMINKIISN